jgi:hypothetical protein
MSYEIFLLWLLLSLAGFNAYMFIRMLIDLWLFEWRWRKFLI